MHLRRLFLAQLTPSWSRSLNPMQSLCKSLALLMLLILNILARTTQHSGGLANTQMYIPNEQPDNKYPLGIYTRAIVSEPAPYFEGTAVINKELARITLSQYIGRYVVLVFYALDFTTVCPSEIAAFSDRIEDFRRQNAELIACSVDSPHAHLAWMQFSRREGGLGDVSIPLLSDLNHQISRDYGVYMPDLGHSVRGLFIIDSRGILRHSTINSLKVARSVDETLRLLHAFRHVDKTGGTCGADWKPAEKIKAPATEKNRKYPAARTGWC